MIPSTMKDKWILAILILCQILQRANSLPESLSYVAAVAEYSPVSKAKVGQTLADANAENYLKFAGKASQYGADILVFPESSLSYAPSYIPNPKDGIIPCLDINGKYAHSLRVISCAARNHSMYVVVNHREKFDCPSEAPASSCPSSGYLTYNTNVAFDRTGKVVARYRKFNLFGEWGVNVTARPEHSIFRADFGVTFGQFICFDLMFPKPALSLVHDLGVTDIVYSAHWFSELPHLFAVQAQAGWSYANDVNMLASGYNNPDTASGGSGIYLGQQGYVHVTAESKKSNILIVSKIPKVINGKRSLKVNETEVQIYEFSKEEISTGDKYTAVKPFLYRTEDLKSYTTELIDPELGYFNKTICDRGMCCAFDVKYNFNKDLNTTGTKYYRYRAAIFNGVRSYPGIVITGSLKVCSVVSCLDENLSSCGRLHGPKVKLAATTFQKIDIAVMSANTSDTFFMPLSLTEKIVPLNAADFSFAQVDRPERVAYRMSLTKPRSDLITFAVFGRYPVEKDEKKESSKDNSGGSIFPSMILIVAGISLYVLT